MTVSPLAPPQSSSAAWFEWIADGLECVFEIGPAFRAEPSFTTRHETEFTSIDMEAAWIDSHEDLMRLEEEWLAYVSAEVRNEHRKEIREIFDVELRVPAIPFPRVSIEGARAIHSRDRHRTPREGRDLDSDAEQQLAAHVLESRGHDFVFLTNYAGHLQTRNGRDVPAQETAC